MLIKYYTLLLVFSFLFLASCTGSETENKNNFLDGHNDSATTQSVDSGQSDYDLGVHWFIKEDNVKAVEYLESAVAKGHHNAHHYLGNHYSLGLGVPVNNIKARELYGKAASFGIIEAQYDLAMSHYASGVERIETLSDEEYDAQIFEREHLVPEYVEMYKALKIAANVGYLPAQHELAGSYDQGLGVIENVSKSIHWDALAADAGFPESQVFLCVRYHSLTEPPNPTLTKKYCEMAKKNGDSDGMSERILLELNK